MGGRAGENQQAKIKWPLWFRFLDPTLSVASFPLPGIEFQPGGATSCRSFPSATPIIVFKSMDQPQLPSSANKLIRPVRRPSAGVQVCVNYNDLVLHYDFPVWLSTIIFGLKSYPLDSGDPDKSMQAFMEISNIL